MASVVFHTFRQIQAQGSMKLFRSHRPGIADGQQRRDFVYVKDVCRVMQTLLQQPSINGIINLGTGKARTWNDLMRAVFVAMDVEPSISYVHMPEQLSKQYQNYTQADMSTFSNLLPEFRFEELEVTVADYVKGHLLQEWPYY
jgi:ADP-L-glycero-D-manno-heptose 6-epimerase